jgi:acetyl-CoA carboxylase biotin carboxyl carrier protein
MSEGEAPREAPFDLEKLRRLVEMMEEHGLTEVSLKRAGEKWTVRRGLPAGASVAGVPVTVSPAVIVNPAGTSVPPVQTSPETNPQPPVEGGLLIKSPTVGTFYASPTPDDPPFVGIGTRVEPESVVCIVEAMKVFNQIPAEVSGTVVEILVKNGDSVEFGQPLFRVRPG